jgi:ribosomal protein S18 acetylase RimI-like enzyme
MRITVRTARPEDEEFLFELYASTRIEEAALLGWAPLMQGNFLRLQFKAQQMHYLSQVAEVDHRIIVVDDRDAGRIIVLRTEKELVLADIALLPEHRGAGIGASLIRELLDEGDRKGLPVRLHVEKTSRALHLYERLGFKTVADRGMHFHMEWRSDVERSLSKERLK